MKKMMIIAAITVVAGMAQAAQISWTANGILAPGGTSIGVNGYGFAFTGTEANRAAVLSLFGTETWATDFANYRSGLVNAQTVTDASIGANSHVALGGGAVTSAAGALLSGGPSGAYGGAAPANAFVGSTQQGVFFVVFDNADWTLADNYSVSVLNTQTLNGTGIKQYTTGWANFGGPGVAGTWTAVPEPTSMALLALGVAALGLRRKCRR